MTPNVGAQLCFMSDCAAEDIPEPPSSATAIASMGFGGEIHHVMAAAPPPPPPPLCLPPPLLFSPSSSASWFHRCAPSDTCNSWSHLLSRMTLAPWQPSEPSGSQRWGFMELSRWPCGRLRRAGVPWTQKPRQPPPLCRHQQRQASPNLCS